MNRLRLMALAAAAVAAMSGAPSSKLPTASLPGHYFGWGGGRRRRGLGVKNETARDHGIPKAFRQYARRYGSSVEDMVQMHRRIPAPMLDHWLERRKTWNRMAAIARSERLGRAA